MSNRIFKLLALGLVLVGLGACTPAKDDAKRIRSTGGTPRVTSGMTRHAMSGQIELNGIVYADSMYQNQFQEAVTGFMSGSVPESNVGYVSAQGEQNTGFYFGGYVPLASGALRGYTNQRVNVSSSAQLLVQVYDHFPNQSDLASLPAVFLNRAEGFVENNVVYIKFYDQYGMVEMEGEFDQSIFRGQFHYTNFVHAENGIEPHEGTIGDFEVPTCQFFVCN